MDMQSELSKLGCEMVHGNGCCALIIHIGPVIMMLTDTEKLAPPQSPTDNCILDLYTSDMTPLKTIECTALEAHKFIDVAARWWQYLQTGDANVLWQW